MLLKRTLLILIACFLSSCGSGHSVLDANIHLKKLPSLTVPATPKAPAPAPTPSSTPAVTTPQPKPQLTMPSIIQDFIPFSAQRKNEMRLYSLRHYGINSYRLSNPHLIIEHFTETSNFSETYNTFAPDTPDSQYHELPNTCSHFVVDSAGKIYQLVPLNIMCRSVVGLNYTALAIENVGFSDQQILDNPREMRASLALTKWLSCRYHIPTENVIGHNESLSNRYYRELVPTFRGQTHNDWTQQDMNIYRSRLSRLSCS